MIKIQVPVNRESVGRGSKDLGNDFIFDKTTICVNFSIIGKLKIWVGHFINNAPYINNTNNKIDRDI